MIQEYLWLSVTFFGMFSTIFGLRLKQVYSLSSVTALSRSGSNTEAKPTIKSRSQLWKQTVSLLFHCILARYSQTVMTTPKLKIPFHSHWNFTLSVEWAEWWNMDRHPHTLESRSAPQRDRMKSNAPWGDVSVFMFGHVCSQKEDRQAVLSSQSKKKKRNCGRQTKLWATNKIVSDKSSCGGGDVETVQNRDVGMPRAGDEYDQEVMEAGGWNHRWKSAWGGEDDKKWK